MAKIQKETSAPANKNGERELEVKPEGASAIEVGEWYHRTHPEMPFKSVHVTPDGEVFPGTPAGLNSAKNYAAAKGFTPESIEEVTR